MAILLKRRLQEHHLTAMEQNWVSFVTRKCRCQGPGVGASSEAMQIS